MMMLHCLNREAALALNLLNISMRLRFSFNNSVQLVFELYFDYSFWYFESPLHAKASFSMFSIGHTFTKTWNFLEALQITWSFNNLISGQSLAFLLLEVSWPFQRSFFLSVSFLLFYVNQIKPNMSKYLKLVASYNSLAGWIFPLKIYACNFFQSCV